MTHLLEKMKYYGDTVIGEKGQIVVPADMRKKFGIEAGDKFLVLAGEQMGAWGIVLVKADVLSQIVQNMFGGKLHDILEQAREEQ